VGKGGGVNDSPSVKSLADGGGENIKYPEGGKQRLLVENGVGGISAKFSAFNYEIHDLGKGQGSWGKS